MGHRGLEFEPRTSGIWRSATHPIVTLNKNMCGGKYKTCMFKGHSITSTISTPPHNTHNFYSVRNKSAHHPLVYPPSTVTAARNVVVMNFHTDLILLFTLNVFYIPVTISPFNTTASWVNLFVYLVLPSILQPSWIFPALQAVFKFRVCVFSHCVCPVAKCIDTFNFIE